MTQNPFNTLEYSSKKQVLRRAIITEALYFTEHLVFDFRPLLCQAEHLKSAGFLMWQLIKPHQPEVLVGPGFGAAPLCASIALAALEDGVSLNILMVRDKRKEHNQKKWVEGKRNAAQGKRAIMIDDFIKAGSAYPMVQQALKSDKVALNMVALATFFDMWEPLGTRQLSLGTLPVLSLFSRHDIGLSRDCYDAKPPLMKGEAPDFLSETPRWWRMSLNKNSAYTTKCAPKIVNNQLLVADERSTLWQHDLFTGDINWSRPSLKQPLKGIVQELQTVGSSVVYSCYDGSLSKVDVQTGDLRWRYKLDSSIHATPSIDQANQRIFINTEQWNDGQPMGHIQCLDLISGKLLWRNPHAWWPPGSTSYCNLNNIVLAPCNDQTLQGFNAATGQHRWTFTTQGLVRGRGAIFTPYSIEPSNASIVNVANNNNQRRSYYLVATEKGYLHCIDVSTGGLLWQQRCGKGSHHQMLQIDESQQCVYVIDGKWHFMSLDLATGSLKWFTRLRSPGVWQPVRCGQYWVILSQQGHVAVIDPLRELKVWEGSIPGRYYQSPDISVEHGIFAAASSNQGLYTFNIHPFYTQNTQNG